MASLPPGSLFFFGAVLALLLRGRYLKAWLVVVPLASLAHLLLCMPDGHLVRSEMLGHELVPIRVDRLSLVWGYVFHLAALIASIYAIQVRDRAQHSAAMIYVGASIAAIFAGDLLTLFLYWEITAVSSVFLVWAGRSKDSLASGMRYVLMHVGSGVLVLSPRISASSVAQN